MSAGLSETIIRRAPLFAAALAVLVTATTVMAARRQSTTFDEIFMVGSGVRGFETGKFVLAGDHPPLMQYLYGLPAYLTDPSVPAEPGWDMTNRFIYARDLYFNLGNDPEQLAFVTRFVAALIAGALVYAVFSYARTRVGPVAGLLAALLVGFTPDLLGHGGVAYNDVPVVLAIFLATWAIDRAVRDPAPRRVALAAFAIGMALAVKFSALMLGPIALLILGMEALARGRDGAWWKRVAVSVPIAVVALYLTLVLANRGDFTLDLYRKGLGWALYHSGKGHSVPAYFLGEHRFEGFWYFYPVLFFFKTPAALHALLAIAAGFGVFALRERVGAARATGSSWWRPFLTGPLRAMTASVVVMAWVLLTAKLNIGFRHALPILPPLLVLASTAIVGFVRRYTRLRVVAFVLVALFVGSTMAQYPNFLSYTSEYVDRERADHLFADSSLDWGQGMIQLRDWMRDNDVDRVYLSYFGSGLPQAYGVDYVAIKGYFQIYTPDDTSSVPRPRPRWTVISATNRAGVYLPEEDYDGYLDIPPAFVIANHLYVYPAAE